MDRLGDGVSAEYLMNYDDYQGTSADHAQLEDLERLGFTIIRRDQPRTVMLGPVIFTEGKLQARIDFLNELRAREGNEIFENTDSTASDV
jgi:hypothetical protein